MAMRFSDFFMRGRHLFGYLLPGTVVTAATLLILGENPIELVEEGNVFVRGPVFLIVSYLIGFSLQTLTFKETKPDEVSEKTKERLKATVRHAWAARTHQQQGTWDNAPIRLMPFCKTHIRQNSKELGGVLLEIEDDINLLAAAPSSLVILWLGWLTYCLRDPARLKLIDWVATIIVTLAVAILAILLRRGFRVKREHEEREVFELFLLSEIENDRCPTFVGDEEARLEEASGRAGGGELPG